MSWVCYWDLIRALLWKIDLPRHGFFLTFDMNPSSENQGQSVGSGEKAGRKFSVAVKRARTWKTFVPPFLPTRLTSPGSPRMKWLRQHHWKERLKMNETVKFESIICWKLTKIYLTSKAQNFTDVWNCMLGEKGGGAQTCPPTPPPPPRPPPPYKRL